eukprot:13944205-Ditylum_brightwellii.AAC.1
MNLWEEGLHRGLVENTATQAAALEGLQPMGEEEEEHKARQYNGAVLSGRLRQAVQRAMARERGGVLYPTDACTKSGQPVLE